MRLSCELFYILKITKSSDKVPRVFKVLSALFFLGFEQPFGVAAEGVFFQAEGDWVLPPVVAEGSPVEAMSEDPVLPSKKGSTISSGSGAIQHSLDIQTALPVQDQGSPGERTSFQGLGRSSDETAVQAFGVPLNSPQGGGLDLSIFPQYLWSGYQFQVGPSLGGFDPRGVAGTLHLIPWSQRALMQAGSKLRVTQFFSGAGLNQLSVGGKTEGGFAGVLGWSEGVARGPSAALSGRWGSGRISGKYHLLMTRLDAETPGTLQFPTPNARQVTVRVIPVLQADFSLSSEAYLKSSVFFDGGYLRNEDPDDGFVSGTHTWQLGFENGLFWKNWRFGLGLRRVTMKQSDFEAPQEVLANLSVSRALDVSGVLVEPSVQVFGLNAMGFRPGASLGVRKDLDSTRAIFSRVSFSHKLPNLVDRFYIYRGPGQSFVGNPDLEAERNWTLSVGRELNAKEIVSVIQGYVQLKQNTQITLLSDGTMRPANSGKAQVFGLLSTLTYPFADHLTAVSSAALTHSRVESTGRAFAYLPRASGSISLQVHPVSGGRLAGEIPPKWLADFTLRTSSSRIAAPSGNRLGGYGLVDLGGQYRLFSSAGIQGDQAIHISTRLENIFDRSLEILEGYPLPGRVISIALTGEF